MSDVAESERRGATRILRGDRAADKKKQQPGVPGLVRNYLISQLIEDEKFKINLQLNRKPPNNRRSL